MSSTKRGSKRQSHISDYYVTPVADVRAFLGAWMLADPGAEKVLRTGRILDPCAGGDSAHPMSYPTALVAMGTPQANILTNDLRADSPAVLNSDYISEDLGRFDLIITNPPFSYAQEIIEKALKDVLPGGYVAMLLRLNFFGSRQRFSFWRERMPKYTFVHHARMSFTDDGKTDSIEYMHAVWKAGERPEAAMLRVI